MFRDSATDAFNAYQQGRQMGQQVRQRNALASYNPANPQATQNALIQGGNLGAAGDLQQQVFGQQDQQSQMDQRAQAQKAQMQAYVEGEAKKLQGVLAQYGPEEVLKQFDANAPRYQQMGEDPQQLATLRQMLAVNPQAALDALAGIRDPRFVQSGRFLRGFDPLTGKEIFSYDLPQDDDPLKLSDGQTAYDRNGRVIANNPKNYAPPRAPSGGGMGGASQAGPLRVTDQSAYAALPSGTLFIAPDGKTRRKP